MENVEIQIMIYFIEIYYMHKTKRYTNTKYRKSKKQRSSKIRSRKIRKNKSRVRKTIHNVKGGSNDDDELLEKMERGESGFLQKKKKINFIPGKPLLDKFYAVKTPKEKALDQFHQRMRLDEQAYLADLESRDRYLKDPRTRALEERESYSRRPELVDYHIDKKSGKLINTFKSTHGIGIGLNEEKDGPPHEEDWGFYSLDFRGGKRKRKRRLLPHLTN